MRTSTGTMAVSLLAAASAPADAASNAVVIDFDQGRLILGWIGLWLVAALAFAVCADKRLDPLARLSRYLDARAKRNAQSQADNAVLDLARDDPRIMADILAAVMRDTSLTEELQFSPAAETVQTPRSQCASRSTTTRGFKTNPMPGLPTHAQYLPG